MESGNQLEMESATNRAAGELGDPLLTKKINYEKLERLKFRQTLFGDWARNNSKSQKLKNKQRMMKLGPHFVEYCF